MPDVIPKPDAGTQHRFDQGHEVGELAKNLFPGGVDIPDEDFKGNLEQTQKLLSKRKPLFEAAFMVDGLYSRADVLNPVGKDSWDIVEVKSSTEVKDVYLHDLSFQKYVYEKAALKIRKCFLMHINNEYVRKGRINPKGLFSIKDVSSDVEGTGKGISERILEMKKMLAFPKCPPFKIGPHCDDPYECPIEECWEHLPKNSVFSLYWGGKRAFELYEQGVIEIKDIPSGFQLNQRQEIQVWCERNQKHHVQKDEIKQFLKGLQEPLHYFDFETIDPAIPLYNGLKPYQRIPFQFSLHIQQDGKTEHHSFLADGKGDPRPALIKAMKATIKQKGSIIAYNASFEKGVIKELAEAFPKDKKWLLSLNDRMIDLLIPFRNFHYYHPEQHGSASIKKVLPIMTGVSYDDLDISQGDEAGLAYLDLISGKLNNAEISKIRNNLEKYCKQDTKSMINIVDKLRSLAI